MEYLIPTSFAIKFDENLASLAGFNPIYW